MLRSIFLCLWPAVTIPLVVHFTWKEHPWLPVLWYHLLVILTPQIGDRRPSETMRLTGLGCWAWKRWILPTTAVSLLLVLAAMAGIQVLRGEQHVLDLFRPLTPDPRHGTLLILWTLLANPLLEEYYWRGVLLPRVGITCSAIFFWLMHYAVIRLFMEWQPAMLATLPVLAAGLYWGWIRRKHGSLWPCIFTHLAADAVILWAAWELLGFGFTPSP
jgi:membrane protease YdiL (CAAX protease family)